jgi:membrane protein CcdC involved in cytochrome C biogenesis
LLTFGAGVVLPRDMMKLGFVMNWICVLLVSGWTMLGGRILGIELGVVPAWANSTNATLA